MAKYMITALLALIVCCSCEDHSIDPTLMPPATNKGANTFGCLIDGWVYTGGRYSEPHASYYTAPEAGVKSVMDIKVQVDENAYISFRIIDPRKKDIIIYSASSETDNEPNIYTDAVFKNEDNRTEELGDGIVNITRFDINDKVISGTFEGGRVREGRFDLRFN